MRSVAPPHINLAPHEAYVASTMRWLVALLAWFCDAYDSLPPALQRCALLRASIAAAKSKLARDLRRSARALRHSLIARALARS